MSFFKKKSSSGHEIGHMTPEKFLADNKFIPPNYAPNGNERRVKKAEARNQLLAKLEEVNAILKNFTDLLPKDKEALIQPQIRAIEQRLENDEFSLEWLNNSIGFVDDILNDLKNKI